MIIQERVWEDCTCCGKHNQLVQEERYGRDQCRKPIRNSDDKNDYLRMSVHYRQRGAEYLHFCSWLCCLKFVQRIQRTEYATDYFLSLPYVMYDESLPGVGAKDFLAAIKKLYAPKRAKK